jgi:tRNA G10  N-methylase Trm11
VYIPFINILLLNFARKSAAVDTFLWDACRLPLKTNSIDVFITDLPFGKKSGSMVKNWQLYPEVLLEMARVCQVKTGRAAILTKDKKAISKAYTQTAQFWRKRFTYWINIGGLQAGVYVLQRTTTTI